MKKLTITSKNISQKQWSNLILELNLLKKQWHNIVKHHQENHSLGHKKQ